MDIHLVSTLTADDENLMAPALLRVLTSVLDDLPIDYALRIDTPDGHSLEVDHTADAGALVARAARYSRNRPFDS